MDNRDPRWPIGNTNIGRILSIINDGYGLNNFFSQPNDILNTSLYDEPPIKNVVSEKGKEQLKELKYKKDICSNTSCPILHIDFEEDEDIIILPCNHGFNKEAINRWVSDEKAECPVCRFKLDSIEKKNNIQSTENDNINVTNINNFNNIFTPSNSLSNRFTNNTVIYSHPFGPRIERVATIISEDDDDNDLMTAINHVHEVNNATNNYIRSVYNSRIFDIISQPSLDSSYNEFD
jgi:hypothetical protein